MKIEKKFYIVVEDNPHNNGYVKKWYVLEPEESAYPEIEKT